MQTVTAPPRFAPASILPRDALRRIADEPLARFFAIGLAVFAVDRVTGGERVDPRKIVVDDAAYAEMVEIFAETVGRAPSADEIEPLVQRYVMNETLYREARALRLDEGDEMVRERIMQKLRVLMMGSLTTPTPDEAELRAWFEENRDRYRQPERMSLRIARVDGDHEEAKAVAALMNAAMAGDTRLRAGEVSVLPFPDRPRSVLEQVFGPDLIAEVAALPKGVWTALETPRGWQAVLYEGSEPGIDASFEDVEFNVAADWREFYIQRAARQAVEALMASYRVSRAPYDPDAFADIAAAAVGRAIEDEQFEP